MLKGLLKRKATRETKSPLGGMQMAAMGSSKEVGTPPAGEGEGEGHPGVEGVTTVQMGKGVRGTGEIRARHEPDVCFLCALPWRATTLEQGRTLHNR